MEVPITGSNSVNWIQISVPPSSSPSPPPLSFHLTQTYNDEDDNHCASSFSVITTEEEEDSPPSSSYFISRIHKTSPHSLHLIQLDSTIGLCVTFPESLTPLPLKISSSNGGGGNKRNELLLYAVTVSGIAYVIKLKTNFSAYVSSTNVLSPDRDFIEFNLQTYFANLNVPAVTVTCLAVQFGCLVLGRMDGVITCLRLGSLLQTAPGFSFELRDDTGIHRLWGFVSRNRVVASVQDLVISEVLGNKILFVLYSDGSVRVWDLSSHSRIFSHNLDAPVQGKFLLLEQCTAWLRLWVGEYISDLCLIPLTVLCGYTLETSKEMIYVCKLRFTSGDKLICSIEPSLVDIPLQEEVGCVDVKVTSDKIWILKDNGLICHNLFLRGAIMALPHNYALQEEFVAEQLFQNSEHSFEDLLLTTQSIFSSAKDQFAPFVSSIFLRRLLLPGVYHSVVLRATLMDYNKQWIDSDFQALTVDGLKKEILSVIELEGINESQMSILDHWKNFSARYFRYWCINNAPCGLLVHSDGAFGVIRKHSVSVFRGLENTELLIDGTSDKLGDQELELFNDNFERELLVEVLKCVNSISRRLGKTVHAIFYESFVTPQVISSEEIIPRLLKILVTGYGLEKHNFGAEKPVDHKKLRKFSIEMLLSLHSLSGKATSWSKVLNVIENYLQFLVPRKIIQKSTDARFSNLSIPIMIQASFQVAKVMFESALDFLLFVTYLVNISGQLAALTFRESTFTVDFLRIHLGLIIIVLSLKNHCFSGEAQKIGEILVLINSINMLHDDISRIQLELVPMIQEIVFEWFIIQFLSTTPTQSPAIEDFSFQLSLLQIGGNIDKRSWNEKLGKCDFGLALILLQNFQNPSGDYGHISSKCLPNPQDVVSLVREFTSWIIWSKTEEDSSCFTRRATELALTLLSHGQYDSAELLLTIVEANSRREKISRSIQETNGDWCILQHLLGCCLLAQAQCKSHGMLKEKKICGAIRCFFRASSGQGASQALRSLSSEAGLTHLLSKNSESPAAWKLHYYQWAMQIFEQYSINEGACQFALAALEQVDEALSLNDHDDVRDSLEESAETVKGRLWANVFKFTLDLNLLYDAYCAIISNPDEESKYICLRRFIIVLYERGAIKILCDGRLPFIGLSEKIERELAWKAERSDILSKPNPYKVLYAFEMHRHNWRLAATYMYIYSSRLRTESVLKDFQHTSLVLQERLNGLSAATNALHLVHPSHAWIDPVLEGNLRQVDHYPSKKAKKTVNEQLTAGCEVQPQGLASYVDIETIENEYVLTSAEYLLSLANVKWTCTGTKKAPSDLVGILVQTSLYDMAFTVLLKFWKGSTLKRELEKVFSAMAMKCCSNQVGSLWTGNDLTQNLLLPSSKGGADVYGSPDGDATKHSRWNNQWETLENYLEKYRGFHARLPVIVAETLLHTDSQIELPLWLVQLFKSGRKEGTGGMTGQESSPASLFQLYVDYGRYTEATNLLLEYIESHAAVLANVPIGDTLQRPAGIISRKKPFAVWFPYTTIERLWCQLEGLSSSGHMVDQCEKLKRLLHGALQSHLKLVKLDSEDAISVAAR
ncbi:hypothetical protein ACFE04_022174 [Oxalis oulophora]